MHSGTLGRSTARLGTVVAKWLARLRRFDPAFHDFHEQAADGTCRLMAKASGGRLPPDLLSDAFLSELGERARNRQSDIMECLGGKARSKSDGAFIDVVVAAAKYRQFAALYESAPTRSFLRSRLMNLRRAVATARKILGRRRLPNRGLIPRRTARGGSPQPRFWFWLKAANHAQRVRERGG
jgi:hypothetical protein